MAKLKDILSSTALQQLTSSQAQEGAVFRMHLGEEEGVKGKNPSDEGRNKYFIVLGSDTEGNAIGFVLIDSQINPHLPQKRKDAHLKILAENYQFLNGVDRFVDCSDFKVISKERFTTLFGQDKAKGSLTSNDIAQIKQLTIEYEDASPKLLKRFGLI